VKKCFSLCFTLTEKKSCDQDIISSKKYISKKTAYKKYFF